MPLSNAERQRRHRERVKAKLAGVDIEALQAENETLRNEVSRLQEELAVLRNGKKAVKIVPVKVSPTPN